MAPGLADVFSLGHSIPSLRAVADFAQTTLIDLYGPGSLVDLGVASGDYTVYAFRPADLPGGLSFLIHRSRGLCVGVTVDRTLDTFGPEYISSQSLELAESVGNIGQVSVDGTSADDRPSIELPTDSFTATFLVTNAQPEGEPEAEASSSSSSRLRDGTSLIAIPAPRRIPRGSSPASVRADRDGSGVACPSSEHKPARVNLPKSYAPRPPVPPIPEASRADFAPEVTSSFSTGGRVGVADDVSDVRRRAFTVFDVSRHVSQDAVCGDHSDVVCLQKALANAPFLYPGWSRPAVEILPLPVPQFVLLRPGTLCAIIVDARPAGSDLFTLETPFTASPEELLDRAALFLGNVFAEVQSHEHIQCFFNDVQWAMPLKRQLVNGDVFSCRAAPEGPGRPLLGPGGTRHTLQRRREAPYFEVLRAVELALRRSHSTLGIACLKMCWLSLSSVGINSGSCRGIKIPTASRADTSRPTGIGGCPKQGKSSCRSPEGRVSRTETQAARVRDRRSGAAAPSITPSSCTACDFDGVARTQVMSLLLGHSVVSEPDYVSDWVANLLAASWRLDLCWDAYGVVPSLHDPRLGPLEDVGCLGEPRDPTGTPNQAPSPVPGTNHGKVGAGNGRRAGSWVAACDDFPSSVRCTVVGPTALFSGSSDLLDQGPPV